MHNPAAEIEPEERTARLRARCAAAKPRILYSDIAARVTYAHGYVKMVMSDNANTSDVGPVLSAIEGAVAEIEAEREAARVAA